jgi:hypothetical protein
MENIKTKAADLTNHVEEIVQTYYDLARVNLAQAGARAISRAIIFFTLAGLFLCILLLLGIGLALLAGRLLHNPAAGYFSVALLYIVLLVVLYMLRRKIVFPVIRNIVVRKIYDKTDYQL